MASKSEMVEFILDRELPQADDMFHDAIDEIKDKNPEKPITDPDLLQNAWNLYKVTAANIYSAILDKKIRHIDSYKEFVDLLSQWISKEEHYYNLSESNLIEVYQKFMRLDGKTQPSHTLKMRDQRSFYHDPSSDANFGDYENVAFLQ